jgi:hypothetical protein
LLEGFDRRDRNIYGICISQDRLFELNYMSTEQPAADVSKLVMLSLYIDITFAGNHQGAGRLPMFCVRISSAQLIFFDETCTSVS